MPPCLESLSGIYGITDDRLMQSDVLPDKVRAALDGGISLLQYRSKIVDSQQQHRQVEQLLPLCQSYGVPLIVNDDVSLCHAVGADGVHLGRSDSSIDEARALLGDDALIGATCHDSMDLAIAATQNGADYVAFGRFFPSHSKPEATPADPSLLTVARKDLSVPIVAIGGINAENGATLIQHGAQMLAVIHSLFAGDDIRKNAQLLVRLFEQEQG